MGPEPNPPATATVRALVSNAATATGLPATATDSMPAPTPYRSPRQHVAATALLVSMLAAGAGVVPELPLIPAPKPKSYRVNLSKSERRGRTAAEIQAMREARCAR